MRSFFYRATIIASHSYLPIAKIRKRYITAKRIYFLFHQHIIPPALRSAQLDIPYTFLLVCYGEVRCGMLRFAPLKEKSYCTYGMYIKSITTYTLRSAQLPLYLFSFAMVDDLRYASLRYLLSSLSSSSATLRFAQHKSIITYRSYIKNISIRSASLRLPLVHMFCGVCCGGCSALHFAPLTLMLYGVLL